MKVDDIDDDDVSPSPEIAHIICCFFRHPEGMTHNRRSSTTWHERINCWNLVSSRSLSLYAALRHELDHRAQSWPAVPNHNTVPGRHEEKVPQRQRHAMRLGGHRPRQAALCLGHRATPRIVDGYITW